MSICYRCTNTRKRQREPREQ